MELRESQKHVTNASCVSEFGYFEDKNYPTRQAMEDRIKYSLKLEYVIEDKFDKDSSGLFAILDGHGGG